MRFNVVTWKSMGQVSESNGSQLWWKKVMVTSICGDGFVRGRR